MSKKPQRDPTKVQPQDPLKKRVLEQEMEVERMKKAIDEHLSKPDNSSEEQ